MHIYILSTRKAATHRRMGQNMRRSAVHRSTPGWVTLYSGLGSPKYLY